MKNYIVLHTHWDREWYFTTSDSLVLMDRTFKNVINELELYPQISFCLDGQYSVIEEFLNINPDLEAKVKKLASENRLQIGPWHTQTDTQLVAEESIVRNLYYGMYKTKKRFASVMDVGYLPDTFGFCHQMPEIYNLANIDKAVFWRGADFSDNSKPYFNWQGAGGSIAKTINLYGGYGMAKEFSADHNFIEKTLKQIISNYKELGIDGDIVIPVGNDQFEIKDDVPFKVKQINDSYNLDLEVSDYSDSIDKAFASSEYDTYIGEFRKTAYTRLHKSIGSVRYDLKQLNYQAEQLLINEVEPLYVISKQFEIEPSVELLYHAWKLLFEGHAHDGICGCISDAVYDDMINRIKRALEVGHSLKNSMMKQIATKLSLNNSEVLLINPSPRTKTIHEVTLYSEDKVIEFTNTKSQILSSEVIASRDDALVETATGNVYETLPEMYKHTAIIEKELLPYQIVVLSPQQSLLTRNQSEEITHIENQYAQVKLVENQVNINLDNKYYQDVLTLVDIGNDGDTYDFSPLANDSEIEYQIYDYAISNHNLKQTIKLYANAKLPYALEDRIAKTNLKESKVEITISLYQNDPKIYFAVKLENEVLSHKLVVRLNIGSNINATISSSAYGQIERNVDLDEEIKDWQATNVEKPVSIETFDGFVKSKDDNLTIISSFGKEYQAHLNYIDLTVFATTGELGKSDLLNRPGRASGDVTKKGHIRIDTPKAQCLGQVNFSFALASLNNDYFETMNCVQDYKTNTISYQIQDINKFEGRIDNKLMSYRDEQSVCYDYKRLELATNGYITSIGIDLDGNTIVRGVANDNHYFTSNLEAVSTDLLGNKRNDNLSEFKIFNYQLKG